MARMSKMAGNGSKLRPKQEEAILALLNNRSVEDAARAVKIGPRTVYRWLSEPAFDKAYRAARRPAFGQGTGRLQQSASPVCNSLGNLVGPPRFELGTSRTPSKKYQSLTASPQ